MLELVNKRLKNVEKRGNCFVGFIEGEKNMTSSIEELETINQVAFQTCSSKKGWKRTENRKDCQVKVSSTELYFLSELECFQWDRAVLNIVGATAKALVARGGPTLETLDHTIHIGSTPTFLYFDMYLYSADEAHYVYIYIYSFISGRCHPTPSSLNISWGQHPFCTMQVLFNL